MSIEIQFQHRKTRKAYHHLKEICWQFLSILVNKNESLDKELFHIGRNCRWDVLETQLRWKSGLYTTPSMLKDNSKISSPNDCCYHHGTLLKLVCLSLK